MTFRLKLFAIFTVAIVLAVGLVAAGVTFATRRAFEQIYTRHTDALVTQFQREFERRGHDVVRRVQGIADAEATVRMAIDLSRPQADVSIYVHDATGLAQQHQLDFLDLVAGDGAIISSAEWAARFGYKLEWVSQTRDWASVGPFLMRAETEAGPALALLAVSTVRVGERNLFVVGGERLGNEFLSSLVLPAGMRALLYRNLDPKFTPTDLLDASGPASDAERLAPLIEEERQNPGQKTARISWTHDPASAETFHALPLLGRQKDLLGVLLVASSQRDLYLLEQRIILFAILVGMGGTLLGALLSWWSAQRVTRPVQKLVMGAQQVASGNWRVHVDVRSRDEVGQLAKAFNRMTEQLIEQRDRLVQAERVVAWREVARRLAHELKNPLFPMQITIENLRRARDQNSKQFDEVFRESSETLLAEIENLKTIIGRFSDFAKMPPPELQLVNVNDIVRSVVKLFEGQFSALGRPPITPELHLDEDLPPIQADPVLLQRALENLVLNAMDAMPSGGMIAVSTAKHDSAVRIEVSDTGTGLTPEQCKQLFTPYYTTKQHGTGLGLAIVQSVVSDHGGTIGVDSEAGVGTTFRVDLPSRSPKNSIPRALETPLPAAPPKEA